MEFISPTDGVMSLKQTYRTIINFIKTEPDSQYRLIVGTDSQAGLKEIVYVTAIVIYKVGRGGRFFYSKEQEHIYSSLKQRIFYEVSKSLDIASKLTRFLAKEEDLVEEIQVEIHVDVGEKGPTNSIIKEVVGMVVGSGYEALIKPHAYAASTVADKYTK